MTTEKHLHKQETLSTQFMLDNPTITIITATYNAAKDLVWTLQSIRSQIYPNIQWIIIDGASTDGTVDIIKNNEDIIDYWISEPDTGIYNAWNKALPYIKGEWVQFLGAGDELSDNFLYQEIKNNLVFSNSHQADFVYGKVQIISPKNRIILEEIGKSWDLLQHNWQGYWPGLPSYSGIFHRASLFKTGITFDERYQICSDAKLLLQNINNHNVFFEDKAITRMPLGGISTDMSRILQIRKELLSICNDLKIKKKTLEYAFFSSKDLLKWLFLKLLGKCLGYILMDTFRVVTLKKRKWTVK